MQYNNATNINIPSFSSLFSLFCSALLFSCLGIGSRSQDRRSSWYVKHYVCKSCWVRACLLSLSLLPASPSLYSMFVRPTLGAMLSSIP